MARTKKTELSEGYKAARELLKSMSTEEAFFLIDNALEKIACCYDEAHGPEAGIRLEIVIEQLDMARALFLRQEIAAGRRKFSKF